jgi:hypothetical protein
MLSERMTSSGSEKEPANLQTPYERRIELDQLAGVTSDDPCEFDDE